MPRPICFVGVQKSLRGKGLGSGIREPSRAGPVSRTNGAWARGNFMANHSTGWLTCKVTVLSGYDSNGKNGWDWPARGFTRTPGRIVVYPETEPAGTEGKSDSSGRKVALRMTGRILYRADCPEVERS